MLRVYLSYGLYYCCYNSRLLVRPKASTSISVQIDKVRVYLKCLKLEDTVFVLYKLRSLYLPLSTIYLGFPYIVIYTATTTTTATRLVAVLLFFKGIGSRVLGLRLIYIVVIVTYGGLTLTKLARTVLEG